MCLHIIMCVLNVCLCYVWLRLGQSGDKIEPLPMDLAAWWPCCGQLWISAGVKGDEEWVPTQEWVRVLQRRNNTHLSAVQFIVPYSTNMWWAKPEWKLWACLCQVKNLLKASEPWVTMSDCLTGIDAYQQVFLTPTDKSWSMGFGIM